MEKEKYRHKSFGMLRFTRINGNSGFLFGSEMQSENFIELQLSEGEMTRNLGSEEFYPRKSLFSVKMSSNQFSELITSLNFCSGVPCTIEIMNGELVEQCDFIKSRKSQFQDQFKERMKGFADRLSTNEVKFRELIASLPKAKREELIKMHEADKQEISNNIPYFLSTFQESMDKIVNEAKTEIEANILHKAVNIGLETLDSKRIDK